MATNEQIVAFEREASRLGMRLPHAMVTVVKLGAPLSLGAAIGGESRKQYTETVNALGSAIDAAMDAATTEMYAAMMITREYLDAGYPGHLDHIKRDLRHKVIEECLDKGYVPTTLPEFSQHHEAGGWQMYELRMTVKARPAS